MENFQMVAGSKYAREAENCGSKSNDAAAGIVAEEQWAEEFQQVQQRPQQQIKG